MIWFLILLLVLAPPAIGGEMIFEMADRSGDDFGEGSLVYPTHISFAPYKDLFDLTHFTATVDGEYLLLDLVFGEITNPWKAPEGFFHQHILVFIGTETDTGTKHYEPLGLVFNEPYTYVVRIAPWSLSTLRNYEGQVLAQITVGTIDAQTIRAYIPLEHITKPTRSWRYAVLVGGYDAFGRDLFREVLARNTDWEFGGGGSFPFVDILAPSFGKEKQQDQLRQGLFYLQDSRQGPRTYGLLAVAVTLLLAGFVAGAFVLYRRYGFHFRFRLKLRKREHTKKGSVSRWN